MRREPFGTERRILMLAVTRGNPPDPTLLVPAIDRHTQRVGRVPKAVATDRGMARPSHEQALQALGVVRCSLPKTGPKTAAEQAKERSPRFRRLQRFRAGGEGTHQPLEAEVRLAAQSPAGTRAGADLGGLGRAIAHNLTKYGRLATATAS